MCGMSASFLVSSFGGAQCMTCVCIVLQYATFNNNSHADCYGDLLSCYVCICTRAVPRPREGRGDAMCDNCGTCHHLCVSFGLVIWRLHGMLICVYPAAVCGIQRRLDSQLRY